MIHDSRIRRLNDRPEAAGGRVVYWMQQSQRTRYNHALEFAIDQANRLRLPLTVCFFLTGDYPGASARHYAFLLEGLCDVREGLAARGIPFDLRIGDPPRGVAGAARDAALVVADRGYMPVQRRWRERAAALLDVPLVEVESDAVVPVAVASQKKEYSAATLRPKIMKAYTAFLHPLAERAVGISSERDGDSLDPRDAALIVGRLGVPAFPQPVPGARGGQAAAAETLSRFIETKLDGFDVNRNDPGRDACSGLSPYLHFGHISPLEAARAALDTDSPGRDRFIEELVVRRELSLNFAAHEPACDSYGGLPRWARESLAKHARDSREYLYGPGELENARTHDPYWNAAQREMTALGRMHGYMRMYWAKKILEWSASPEEAWRTALSLNDRYSLDGRDPNSLAGVGWCFGLHDRPWAERPVFGLVRYMNQAGLRRKFDMEPYVARHSS